MAGSHVLLTELRKVIISNNTLCEHLLECTNYETTVSKLWNVLTRLSWCCVEPPQGRKGNEWVRSRTNVTYQVVEETLDRTHCKKIGWQSVQQSNAVAPKRPLETKRAPFTHVG